MLSTKQRGLTMIELVIALGILGMLLAAGMPSITQFMQSAKNRTGAESLLKGVTLARKEAIFRGRPVRFELTDANGAISWKVGCVTVAADCPASIRELKAGDSSGQARVGISTAAIPMPVPADHFAVLIEPGNGHQQGITFNGLGRVPTANLGADITRMDVSTDGEMDGRRYVVTVSGGGATRMCDPTKSFASNPQGC